MTIEDAIKILDILDDLNAENVKKQYRRLMHIAHPDAGESTEQCKYSAQEINEAYAFLMKKMDQLSEKNAGQVNRSNNNEKASHHYFWDADENANAYCERQIFHTVEDSEGEKIGDIVIAEGKYYWSAEEEFAMFQKSIFNCSKSLLEEIDAELNREENLTRKIAFQAEFTFLLAGQFVNSTAMLPEIVGNAENDIYHVAAMLEMENVSALQAKQTIYPDRVKNHRLYIKDENGNHLGYISFADDRLYYVLIPLMEQNVLQYKMSIAEKTKVSPKRKGRVGTNNNANYYPVDMWIRFRKDKMVGLPESINSRIEELLSEYRK